MIPFLAESLAKILKELLIRFLKKSVLAGNMFDIDASVVSDSKNRLCNEKIDIGFASKHSLDEENVSPPVIGEYRDHYRQELSQPYYSLLPI